MKKSIISLLLMVAMLPLMANAEYVQLADGVYQDGSTLYICSGVTSLGDLQVNPSEIYCYATIPPACMANTFTDYGATLHVPAAGMVSYFTTLYWYNFNNILSDAIEPLSVIVNPTEAELEIGQQLSLSAMVSPGNATPNTVYWSTTDASVATVSGDGTVTAMATGECDILAICVDKVAVCHVTVVNPRVTITLDTHEASLLPNHTLTLNATCSPIDVDLAVTSSDPGVAIPRIVNGSIMVVGVSEGTATITVNAADGWGNPDSCVVTVYTELGDTNCDGYINIADVAELIDYLLSGNASQLNLTNADTDQNGSVNIADVSELIDYLLSGRWSWQDDLTFTVNGVLFKMIYVEGGTFTMGATSEQGSDSYLDEKPIHEVSLSSYFIGETAVTQKLWETVMGDNPSKFTGNLDHPVERVSWNDCQSFIAKLNEITGKKFRLLTEAEWEYAARGGNKSQGYKYSGSNNISEIAWFTENSNYSTHPVRSLSPNELGLYDMSGNVMEWCLDWYDRYSSEAQTNPAGPVLSSESARVSRGGDYSDIARTCRVSFRACTPINESVSLASLLGLRLALDMENSSKFCLSETVITVLLGENKSVNIFNGNGNYTVDGGSDNFTSSISSNELTVTGTAAGTNTVYVTDNASGATAVLTVIVINPNIVDGHEYVDLGLPSGTLWATCNVGASSPEEYGDYFAWGETEPKEVYSWKTYKWCSGSYNTLTKYCTNSTYGTVDNKMELYPEDDAAYVNWGPEWRMPTIDQLQELINNCTWTWTTQNGVNGRLVTGPNENTLFLPAAGRRWSRASDSASSYGFYWSRVLYSSYSYDAYDLGFYSDDVYWNNGSRSDGFTVRAVRVSQN